MIKSRFLTPGRDDLFAMTRRLLTAVVAADLPPDSDAPLLIGVGGSLQSGKKIITDAAVRCLFDPGTASMDGKDGYDEYWHGTRRGADFAVEYIDMAYPYRSDYSKRLAFTRPQGRGQDNDMGLKYRDFLAQRSRPGITFVQNPAGYNAECGISLYVEHRTLDVPVGYKIPRLHLAPNSVKAAFSNLAADDKWARLVEIEIRDERLLNNAAFMNEFLGFSPYCRLPDQDISGCMTWHRRLKKMVLIDQEHEPHGIRADVNVFGRDNFPHIVEREMVP